jgi:NDP-sugar pyrophosphorylase family protein
MFYSSITNRGPVVLGYHCETGPNAHIGPYTRIGDNSNVTYTEIENSMSSREPTENAANTSLTT